MALLSSSPPPQPGAASGPQSPPTTEIGRHEIEYRDLIGGGESAEVYRGTCRLKEVAVKVFKHQFDEQTLQDFRQEVEIMSKLNHPNVILFMGACTSCPGELLICTELLMQDLETLLLSETGQQLSLLVRLRMAKGAALGMVWLHNSNPVIIHRDLKTSNLLVDKHFNVKVADFGMSKLKQSAVYNMDGGVSGTPFFLAPERCRGEPCTEKGDVYSFGIVLWQILTEAELFPGYDDVEVFEQDLLQKHIRPELDKTLCDMTNPRLVALTQTCWDDDSAVRPTFQQIVAELDEIILEEAVPDSAGRAFWKQNFSFGDEATWQDLINGLGDVLDLTPAPVRFCAARHLCARRRPLWDILCIREKATRVSLLGASVELGLQCLLSVLSTEAAPNNTGSGSGSGAESVPAATASAASAACEQQCHTSCTGIVGLSKVSVDQFGNVLAWFGSFAEGQLLLTKITQLLRQEWFHGNISQSVAEGRLMNTRKGTFLVRFSTKDHHTYTISKVAATSICHHRISHKACSSVYTINGKSYSSLLELVECERQSMQLHYPCPGTRFTVLFSNVCLGGYQ
eukprot:TRINITY_DN14722_c0_g1_i1.p1 TRINITY_DN14722_c0_g1~~TRINITY_DN14722_c0_g1_i1.p1  ORF type:complete len:587 (-),score=142.17 TRINITY_DN14722_c0_g1_i1:71-1777(-)